MDTMKVDWSKFHFFIECVGMAGMWGMWSFDVDSKWIISNGPGPMGASLIPFRADQAAPVSMAEVLFLANCIGFDHDTPTVVRPADSASAASMPPVQPLVPPRGERSGLAYFDAVEQALMLATEMRVGEPVGLRYDENHLDLTKFEQRFANKAEPLGLYAMATRQIDVLSEYLCLYRVLEWPNRDNGKTFIAHHLDKIEKYDFGSLRTIPELPIQGRGVDVFETYCQRATARISDLLAEGKDAGDIATVLCSRRNALAHGKRDAEVTDFGPTLMAFANDVPIVKLLARMVVESPPAMSNGSPR